METIPSKKKILVVDDEQDILNMTVAVLTHAGYAVTAASGGREAFAALKNEIPNLILLDVNMPGMDGGEVAQSLKNNPITREIPIIFLTVLAPKSESSHKDASGNAYIAKPYNPHTLLSEVKKRL